MWVSAILAAGGRGTRMGADVPKQLLMLGDRSILQRSFEALERHEDISEIVIALPRELAASPPAFLKSSSKEVHIVDGGDTRHRSVANAFARMDETRTDYVLIHDAARPFVTASLIQRVIQAAQNGPDAAIAGLRASDTVKEATRRGDAHPAAPATVQRTLPRNAIYLVQTPQVFHWDVLADAIRVGRESNDATDEATLVERSGHEVAVVEGEPTNIKITSEHDLRVARALAEPSGPAPHPQVVLPKIGVGYDLHRLEPGRPLIIGGVRIPYDKGLAGHSDADVLCHAVTDAILGAAAAGDIGQHFPDTDPQWKGADSIELLRRAAAIVRASGFAVSNIDAVVIAEQPKLLPHLAAIRARLAEAIGVDVSAIGVKGKTNEKVGPIGNGEAIAVHAVALLAPSRESGV
jgi:2-C-methyl-D-erythritol 4-phosphate cytidylyltransferase/2-C-methyl-D-erythritol 2,4-cyclodiphosphate synthase